MILVRNLKLYPGQTEEKLRSLAAKKLRISENQVTALRLTRRSLDARKKEDIHYVCACAVSVSGDEGKIIARARSTDIAKFEEIEYPIPRIDPPKRRPVVVGFGPAGMFAALVLAMAGARPIVIERGQDALSRKAAVDRLRDGGKLDPESNVQFGEGGAGTFSDGKLNTGTHDKRMGWMLSQFAAHGAPESILYEAKPHIGTDILIDVVQNIRRSVISLGGEVRFENRLERLVMEGGRLTGAEIRDKNGVYTLPVLYSFKDPEHGPRLRALAENATSMAPDKLSDELYKHISAAGGIDYTRRVIKRHRDSALDSIAQMPSARLREQLTALLDEIMG